MTEAPPLASEQITQEDREAAHRLMLDYAGDNWRGLLKGEEDRHSFVQAFARHRIAALSTSPAPSGQGVSGEVPDGMKPWAGGDSAPDDWDRGKVQWLQPDGETTIEEADASDPRQWQHGKHEPNIIAYTPKPAPAPSCAPGEVERWQTGRNIPKVEQRHKDAAAWAMDRSPDGLTWDMATAAHVTPDRRWQMNRVAEAMARMERASLSRQPDTAAIEQAAISLIVDLCGAGASQSGTNLRVVEDHLRQFARNAALSPQGLNAKEGGQ